jgi:hypothetical protein
MTFSVMKAGILLPQVGDFATRENVEYITKEAERVPIRLVEHRMRQLVCCYSTMAYLAVK